MTFTLSRRLAALVAAILAIAGLVTIQLVDDDHDGRPDRVHVEPKSTTLGGPGAKMIPKAPTPLQRSTAAALADHRGLRFSAELPRAIERAQQAGLEHLAVADQMPLISPDAAPAFPGCTSRFVRNYGTRGGVAPHELVAHYTVSRNVPGWSDVWSVVSLFDRAAYEASSTFVIDAEGHCAYIVRDTDSPWTQASANRFSVSIEFIAMGDEGKLSPAQLKKGGEVFAIEAKRFGISIRLGAVRNCLPVVDGIIDHAMLGACGGGHHDLTPMYGSHIPTASHPLTAAENARRLAALIAATNAAAGGTTATAKVSFTAGERNAAACLQFERRVARRHGGWQHVDARHLRRAVGCKTQMRHADARIRRAARGPGGWQANSRRARHHAIAALVGD